MSEPDHAAYNGIALGCEFPSPRRREHGSRQTWLRLRFYAKPPSCEVIASLWASAPTPPSCAIAAASALHRRHRRCAQRMREYGARALVLLESVTSMAPPAAQSETVLPKRWVRR